MMDLETPKPKKFNGIPKHPYHRPGATFAGTQTKRKSTSKQTGPQKQRDRSTTDEIQTWLRVTLYDHDRQFHSTYRLGTFYGRRPEILGTQVANILRSRWDNDILARASVIDRKNCEITIDVSHNRTLQLVFTTPGSDHRRSKAQWFGTFLRQLWNQ